MRLTWSEYRPGIIMRETDTADQERSRNALKVILGKRLIYRRPNETASA